MAADRVVAQYALFPCCFYSKPAGTGSPFHVFGKAKNSILSILDSVLYGVAPMEFPHSAMERRRSFR